MSVNVMQIFEITERLVINELNDNTLYYAKKCILNLLAVKTKNSTLSQ